MDQWVDKKQTGHFGISEPSRFDLDFVLWISSWPSRTSLHAHGLPEAVWHKHLDPKITTRWRL